MNLQFVQILHRFLSTVFMKKLYKSILLILQELNFANIAEATKEVQNLINSIKKIQVLDPQNFGGIIFRRSHRSLVGFI